MEKYENDIEKYVTIEKKELESMIERQQTKIAEIESYLDLVDKDKLLDKNRD